MHLSRAVIPMLLAAAILTLAAPGAAMAKDKDGIAVKIQIGGHALTGDTGLISPGIEGSSEDSGGVLATLIILGRDRGRFPWGFGFEIEGNGVKAGPPLDVIGIQTFGIATIRVLGQVEVRLRPPPNGPQRPFQPYVSLGAGWNFHSAGEKISWPASPPSSGTPRRLKMDNSPSIRVGIGFHRRATEAGLSINLEGGWKWDAGDYRMVLQDMPDRRGEYDLSGIYYQFGITLRP